MNNKFVLKALEMDDREWERHLEFISVLRGLSDSDREQLVESLTPQAKPKPRKKTECAKCDYRQSHNIHRNTALTGYHEFVKVSKSARASSLQQQIAGAGNKPKANHEPEGVLTEEESQLVIGAIPLQALPEN